MQSDEKMLRDAFWADVPPLPPGLHLERREPVAVARPGRGGTTVYDFVQLSTPTARPLLVVAYRPRLLAGHVDRVKRGLVALATQRKERALVDGRGAAPEVIPTIVTDVAKPSVVEACRREGVAIIDQRGTVILSTGALFVHVEGKRAVERAWRGGLFAGKASRVTRYLLVHVAPEPAVVALGLQALASSCDLSYAYAHAVLTKLERDGFVDRRSARGGFRLRNPVGLLRAWVESGQRTAVAVEGLYAPDTRRETLLAASKRIGEATGGRPVFSLASALEPAEVHVAALPHAAYWPGDLDVLVDALGLQRRTPHNFLLLRPDPLVWTTAGGLLMPDPARPAPDGDDLERVALPQLVADFATLAGRGREQAEHLLGTYAKRLPYHVGDE